MWVVHLGSDPSCERERVGKLREGEKAGEWYVLIDGFQSMAEAQSTGNPLRNHIEHAPALFHRRPWNRGLYLYAISTRSSSSLADEPLDGGRGTE